MSTPTLKPIRVVIADNDLEFAQNLRTCLDEQNDVKVVGVVRDGQGAVDSCRESLPDLVLLDLHLPVLDSVRAIQAILGHNQRVKILSLSAQPNDRYAIEAVKMGACGYIEKADPTDLDRIITAVRQAAAGEVILNPTLAASILQEFS